MFIPKLMPPDGAQQILKGGNFSFAESFSSAFLDAKMDIATLSAHYAAQLEKAGWTRTGEGQDGPLAWHTWTFQDEGNEPGQGLFFLLKVPGAEHQHFMYVQAKSSNADEIPWFTPVTHG
jgi:hypothetical protein